MATSKKKTFIIIGVVAIAALIIWANIARQSKSAVAVDTQVVDARELRAVVSASGKIRPKVSVNISASTNGKVVRLAVDEGDVVQKGDFLLEIDPTPAEAAVRQNEASLGSARAALSLAKANLEQAKLDFERKQKLFEKQLTSEEAVQNARTAYQIKELEVKSSEQDIARISAALRSARHTLSQVSVHADIDGIVTKRNIEIGENVFVGAFNNPATVLLEIADLSVIEGVIEVDETDIIDVVVGQSTELKLDAYPDSAFSAEVTKVGNSPILSSGGITQQQATSYEVIVQLTEAIPNVRPGLSCKADITTGYREKAIAVPIQALTLRKPSDLKPQEKGRRRASTNGAAAADEDEEEIQGVFVVKDEAVQFSEVRTGIAGDRYFEVLSGLEEDDEVVIGPFRELRRLRNEDAVKPTKKNSDRT